MTHHERARAPRALISRTRIASTAARLIAEDGLTDFGLAKQKAARQLGLPESAALPDNAEVEAELRLYQALYQSDAQPEELRHLRAEAFKIMEVLANFRPYLTGSVLDGTAGAFSAIDLLLFADSAKEVEIFLLDRGMAFEALEPRAGRHAHDAYSKAEAVLRLSAPVADVNLLIFPPQYERQVFRHRDGRTRARARRENLAQLLEKP
ncbi:MAG: hypothetical protein LBS89_05310 [Zoogloeaceae bacterium]|jgi:hypothetical protein|nr:hypothetical protein [Zoogloeaceae bacterium]